AGFTCPNRDGTVGVGGCTFCDNATFSPAYANRKQSFSAQLAEGKDFFRRKYPDMKYLAYFQSFSNTYAPLPVLRSLYEEALQDEDVLGIVVGTRPDCISDELLDYLSILARSRFVLVEYGVESVSDDTLHSINRGHGFRCALDAVRRTAAKGIHVGAHIILGLPGDNIADTIQGIRLLHDSGMKLLKLHQLQIVRGTVMARQYAESPFPLFSADEYIRTVVRFIRELPPTIVYDRFVSQSPKDKVIAPSWGLKNHEFTDKLKKALSSLQ
ncbi:MAG: TIGR01212 family radical SAM protein, partial [Bacteroidaceae bacterium]|nr:TIGR01212 family radical SAM protein [Bacteroidaceae bacterium]